MKKNISTSVVLNICSVIISFILTSFLSKNLSIYDYGKYQLILTYIGVISVFSINGLNLVINKRIINNDDWIYKSLVANTYKIVILIFLFFIITLLLLKEIFHWEKIEAIIIATIFIPVIGLEKYEPVLNAKNKFLVNRILFLISTLSHVIFSMLIFYITHNYFFVILSFFMTRLLVNITGLFYSFKILNNDCYGNKYDKNTIKSDIIEGIKISLLSLYNTGIGYLDKIILGFIDYRLLALYSIGSLVPIRIKDQLKLVANIMIQSWAKDGKRKFQERIKSRLALFFILNSALAVILALSSKIYIPIIFDNKYFSSYSIVWIISASIPFLVSSSFLEMYLIFFDNFRSYKVIIISQQILYIFLLIILTIYYNIIGIALAFLIRSAFSFFLNLYFYLKNISNT